MKNIIKSREVSNKLQTHFKLNEDHLEEKLSQIYNIIFEDMFRFDKKIIKNYEERRK